MNQILEKSLVWEPASQLTREEIILITYWRLSRVDLERSLLMGCVSSLKQSEVPYTAVHPARAGLQSDPLRMPGHE